MAIQEIPQDNIGVEPDLNLVLLEGGQSSPPVGLEHLDSAKLELTKSLSKAELGVTLLAARFFCHRRSRARY